MLETVELEILEILMSEKRFMRASEISSFIDQNYQLIGKRTGKLRDLGLVEKKNINNISMNKITDIAQEMYFGK
jgi:predicted transcriptional regulator